LVCTRFRDQFNEEYVWKYFALANGISAPEEEADWKTLLMDFWQVHHLSIVLVWTLTRCSAQNGVLSSKRTILNCQRTIRKRFALPIRCRTPCCRSVPSQRTLSSRSLCLRSTSTFRYAIPCPEYSSDWFRPVCVQMRLRWSRPLSAAHTLSCGTNPELFSIVKSDCGNLLLAM